MTNQRLRTTHLTFFFFSINSPSESVVMISLVRMWFRNLGMRLWLMIMLRSWMNMMLRGKVTKTMTLLTTANGKQLTLKNDSRWCDDKRNFPTLWNWNNFSCNSDFLFLVKSILIYLNKTAFYSFRGSEIGGISALKNRTISKI